MLNILVVIFFFGIVQLSQGQVLISLLLGDKLNSGKVEFGLEGGVNFSTLRNTSGNLTPDFNLGFYFDLKMKNPQWMIHTGVIVKSSMGTQGLPVYSLGNADLDKVFAGGEVHRKINYFNVPFLMKYKFKNNFYAEGGIQLGLRTTASDIFSNQVVDKEDLTYSLNTSDRYYRLDGGLAAGLGYRFMKGNGMNLGVRYYYGLADIAAADDIQLYNRSLYVTLGIPIGAGKAKARDEK